VLIEGSRTNLLVRSQEFDNAAWGDTALGAGVTPIVTANAGVALDGTMTADRIQFSLGGGTTSGDISRRTQGVTIPASAHTNSVFLRSFDGVSSYVMHIVDPSGATRNITITGDWQRFPVTATGTGGAVQCSIGLRGAQAPTNSDTADVLAWGFQVEAGSFPSSYVKSEAAAATRAADVLTYTAGVSYPLQLWSEFERAVDTGGAETVAGVYNGSVNDGLWMFVNASDKLETRVTTGAVTQATPVSVASIAAATVTKGAARAATNDIINALNGTLSTQDTSSTMPPSPTTLGVGYIGGSLPPFGYIRRIAIIQGAGTDAQLQSMMT
jgi:hypothetical protein